MLFKNKKKDSETTSPDHELPPGLALKVENVSKRFKNFEALRKVSFEVPRGQCLGIVGFNGAGKSTLLQIIADTLQASEGRVLTRGRVVAMLDLGAGFNPEYTGLENLYMNAAIFGVPQTVVDERLDEIEAFAEIGNFLRKPVKTYSSGMRVRLAFSLLTQIDPDIMIIDEALAVGDAYFAHKCTHLIKKYREEGKTFLFVSHSPTMVTSLCDRAILLDHGSVLRDGTPANILEYYGAMIAQLEREAEIKQIQKENGRTVTRSGNGKAKIVRFELTDEKDQPRRNFKINETIKVSCVIEAAETLQDPTIGFMIRDRFGNDVYGTNTLNLKKATGTLSESEQLEARFQTQLNLGLGEYSLTLAVHKGSNHLEGSYDWFDRLIVFQVLPNHEPAFSGVAYLPTTAIVTREIQALNRTYEIGSTIDFSDSGNSHRYRSAGWQLPESYQTWTNGNLSVLELTSESFPSQATLELHLTPFVCEALPSQNVEIRVNGTTKAKFQISETKRLSIPLEGLPKQGSLVIEFVTPDASSPAEFNLSSDKRVIALAFHQAKLLPVS
ncbi:ABC transporter ATP-binding protein [Pelagicoccus sp. NFK12]|uniref:ABC transporter ATP-binding protein n=1 Tax=Pelagicoccus enzymogenes TaxID=2773457 RepID=A0A927FAN8_9BACT|nr:ABC transporter ATP-binding protein [Pelagicoccus enzymogenes]MBD5780910.1 ABC transporter ATP-binding protein [Pelagicoccus enzymogenes]